MYGRWAIIPKMSDFFFKSVLYVSRCSAKTTNALTKRIPYLESREIALSGSWQRFFKQTSSSASKIQLKSGNFPKMKVEGLRYAYDMKAVITVLTKATEQRDEHQRLVEGC